MKYLVIDFESKDPYIDRDVGAGWVYAMRAKSHDFKALCCGIAIHTNTDWVSIPIIHTDWQKLKEEIMNVDVLIAHNAMYDCGILMSLGIDIKDKIIVDTVILAKLFRNNLPNFKLSYLAKTFLKEQKTQGTLGQAVWEAGIYPLTKSEQKKATKDPLFERKKPLDKKLTDWAYANMDITYEHCKEVVEDYCQQDVNLCWQLFVKFGGLEQSKEQQILYSNCLKALMDMRLRGIRIDLTRAREVHQQLVPLIAKAYQKCYDLAGEEFNLNSCKDVPRIFDKLKIKYPINERGNPNIESKWLEEQEHPIAASLVEARKLMKLDRDFIQKIIGMQQYTLGISPEKASVVEYGRIHPTITLLGASKTGRMSSSAPNIQQIPKHDETYAKLVRSIFIPEEGEVWVKADYSNQEGRIQLHFASKLQCKGVETLIKAYNENPHLDMHQRIADMAKIIRDHAKMISHAIGFGLGQKKLIKSLKVPELEGIRVLDQFHEEVPYLKDFMRKCIDAMESKGYIKTLDGRKLFNDRFIKNGEEKSQSYKAISKVVQGSAAGQTNKALEACYLQTLPLLNVVHDEFNMSVPEKEVEYYKTVLNDCMCDAYQLEVPVVVELTRGKSWGEASFPEKKIDNKVY